MAAEKIILPITIQEIIAVRITVIVLEGALVEMAEAAGEAISDLFFNICMQNLKIVLNSIIQNPPIRAGFIYVLTFY